MISVLEARLCEPPADDKVACIACRHEWRNGEGGINSYRCRYGALLVEYFGFAVRRNAIPNDLCRNCGTRVEGIGMGGS